MGGNWAKNVETSMIHTLEMVKRLSLAEIISEITGKVWNHSEESSEDEEDGIHAYLECNLLAGEQWNPWELRLFNQHMLAH